MPDGAGIAETGPSPPYDPPMPRTLIVTNDFPPRRGGIESFVRALADRLGDVVVYTASMPGDAETDAALGYPVIRDRSGTLLPTKRVRDAVVATFTEHGCDRVLIGSSVPLGLLAPALRAAGATRIVAVTHGHEVWWSRLPGTRQALRRVGDAVDVLTDISDWTRAQIGRALSAQGRAKQTRLAPGVDTEAFRPGRAGPRCAPSSGSSRRRPSSSAGRGSSSARGRTCSSRRGPPCSRPCRTRAW